MLIQMHLHFAPPRNCIETVQTVVETSVETVANYIETVDYSLTMALTYIIPKLDQRFLQIPNGFYNGFYKGSYSSYTVSTETVTLYYKRPCNLKVMTAETPIYWQGPQRNI